MHPDTVDIGVYERFERNTVREINANIDHVLAVSGRVKEIVVAHGIDEGKTHISYIGTRVAERLVKQCASNPTSPSLHIVYMGYMNKQKGFYFFLNALEQMPEELSKGLSVCVIARHNEENNSCEIIG